MPSIIAAYLLKSVELSQPLVEQLGGIIFVVRLGVKVSCVHHAEVRRVQRRGYTRVHIHATVLTISLSQSFLLYRQLCVNWTSLPGKLITLDTILFTALNIIHPQS